MSGRYVGVMKVSIETGIPVSTLTARISRFGISLAEAAVYPYATRRFGIAQRLIDSGSTLPVELIRSRMSKGHTFERALEMGEAGARRREASQAPGARWRAAERANVSLQRIHQLMHEHRCTAPEAADRVLRGRAAGGGS